MNKSAVLWFKFLSNYFGLGARFNGPVKLLLFTCEIKVSTGFNETFWSILQARTCTLILFISI